MEGIMAYSDSGLPGILFSLLDQEEDSQVWFPTRKDSGLNDLLRTNLS
jgi:hypothetical protein